MSGYKPGLDDDRMVGDALEALARETNGMEAPVALEERLRAAFRESVASALPPPAARHARRWEWVAILGAAAGLVWLAVSSLRTPDRQPANGEQVLAAKSPVPLRPAAPAIAAAPRATERVVATTAPRASRVRRARPEPVPNIERFEPLYPGDVLADLDAVHLMRVSVPRSALATLGWPDRPGLGARDRVELEAMVGPDGVTRAVRFIGR